MDQQPDPLRKREPYHGRWREVCRRLAERPEDLRQWERAFVADLPEFQRISTRQRYTLKVIAERVLKGAG
jgi:hypothetical protein